MRPRRAEIILNDKCFPLEAQNNIHFIIGECLVKHAWLDNTDEVHAVDSLAQFIKLKDYKGVILFEVGFSRNMTTIKNLQAWFHSGVSDLSMEVSLPNKLILQAQVTMREMPMFVDPNLRTRLWVTVGAYANDIQLLDGNKK